MHETKTCRNCGGEKSKSDFYRHSRMLDGHLNVCKPCVRKRVKKHRASKMHPNYNGEDITVDLRRSADRRPWRTRNPAAYKAQSLVGRALKSGRLTQEPCLFCGATRVQAHHRDYAKPLEVIWLCAKCHNRLHKFFPETEGANKEVVR